MEIEEGGVRVAFYMYKKNLGLECYLLCDKLLMFKDLG